MTTDRLPRTGCSPRRTTGARARRALAAAVCGGAALFSAVDAHAVLPCHAYPAGSAERMNCEYLEWAHGGGTRASARYGAIAYDAGSRAYGWSHRWATRAQAEQRALHECRAAGGTGCVLATWFQNRCGALATAPGGAWGSTSAPSGGAAADGALAECARRAGGERCKVLVRGCSG